MHFELIATRRKLVTPCGTAFQARSGVVLSLVHTTSTK